MKILSLEEIDEIGISRRYEPEFLVDRDIYYSLLHTAREYHRLKEVLISAMTGVGGVQFKIVNEALKESEG